MNEGIIYLERKNSLMVMTMEEDENCSGDFNLKVGPYDAFKDQLSFLEKIDRSKLIPNKNFIYYMQINSDENDFTYKNKLIEILGSVMDNPRISLTKKIKDCQQETMESVLFCRITAEEILDGSIEDYSKN